MLYNNPINFLPTYLMSHIFYMLQLQVPKVRQSNCALSKYWNPAFTS